MLVKVVIVDDHKMVREGIRQLLEFDGKIKVLGEAGNGLECLEYLEKKELSTELVEYVGEFDLVINKKGYYTGSKLNPIIQLYS